MHYEKARSLTAQEGPKKSFLLKAKS